MTTSGETANPTGDRQTLSRERHTLSRFTPLLSKLQTQQAPEAEDFDDDLIEDGEGPKTIMAKSLDSIQQVIPQVKSLRQMIPKYKKRAQENTRYYLARMVYKLNLFMQKPGSSAILLLFLWAMAVIIGAILLRIVPAHDGATASDALYLSWRIISDGSNHLDEYVNGPLAFFFGVLIFVLGLVVTGLIIGFLTNTIVTRMDALRKGDGKIIERNHFLILGWSPKVPAIILTCCKSETAAQCIVVLADRKKELMDNDIQNSGIPSSNKRIRIITKEGDPGNPQVLKDVSVALARCTIILADASLGNQADTTTIMRAVTVLGIPKLQGFIVAEMTEKDKISIISKIGGNKVVPLFSAEFVGRLICQCGRQPGLAGVYSYLLDFVGSDFYVKDCPPHLVGKTYNEIAFHLSDGGTLCGVLKNTKIDEDDKEKYRFISDALLVNPSNDRVIKPGDQLLVLSEEFATSSFLASPRSFDRSKIVMPAPFNPPTDSNKQFLIIGWRVNMSKIIAELGEYLPEGSTVTILSDRPPEERRIDSTSQIKVEHVVGNPLLPETLNAHLKRQDPYTAIFVLSDRSETASDYETESSDNRSVVVSLMLAEMLSQGTPLQKPSLMKVEVSGQPSTRIPGNDMPLIVTEINDVRKMSLISNFHQSDGEFIVANHLVGMAIAQLATQYYSRLILDELLTPGGSDVSIIDHRYYIETDTPISFFALWLRGRLKGATIIGYMRLGKQAVINPSKKHKRIKFKPGDKVIVITSAKKI